MPIDLCLEAVWKLRHLRLGRGEHGLLTNLEIRNITPVAKGEGDSRDCFQKAIWIADRLCRFALVDSSSQSAQRIIRVDMTDLITSTIQQFDGISFYKGSA